MARPLESGMVLAVRYRDDPQLWHERRLLWQGDGSHYYLLSPDREILLEDLRTLRECDIDRWRNITVGLPGNIDINSLYRFEDAEEGALDDDDFKGF
eukprot:9505349-Karenia_brevis.AAC.1